MIALVYFRDSGHETRSTALAGALRELEAQVECFPVAGESDIPELGDFPLTVMDLPEWLMLRATWDWKGGKLVAMGYRPRRADLVWHPLGPPSDTPVLRGREYLILPPDLQSVYFFREGFDVDLLVYFGAAHRWWKQYGGGVRFPQDWRVLVVESRMDREDFLRMLAKTRRALLGWGQTVFEASFLGTPVVVVADKAEHVTESWRFGLPALHASQAAYFVVNGEFPDLLRHAARVGPQLDRNGARRTAEAILELL